MKGNLRTRIATVSTVFAVGAVLLLLSGVSRAESDTVAAASNWSIDTVEALGPGKFTSLKVDSLGNVHVVYSIEDNAHYPLRYAIWTKANKRWFTMQIGAGAAVCSLTLDSKQRPHISWADFGSGFGAKLHYTHWDGTAWRNDPIRLNSEVISYYNSIALDSHDNPAISFYEYQGPRDTDFRIRLRTVIWNGQEWDLRTVDQQPGSGKFNSMASDAKGHLHIAYANVSAGTAGMRYAYWDGTSWKREILEGVEQNNGDAVGFSANIAIDKDGNPHVTYMNETTPTLRYAVRKNGRWQIQNVDGLARVGYPDRNSITIDDQGRPYIGYYDAGKGVLKVAHPEGSRWFTEIVDGGGAGFTSSMEIADGTIWISYADSSGALKVAHRKLAGSPPSDAPVPSAQAKK
jgi:hypothetical protein